MYGILLVNLGTPGSPSVADVRKYLSEFLNDPRVIDISGIARTLLVNAIIVPFRSPKTAALYRQIWTEKGSPLLMYGKELEEKLQQELGGNYHVALGMRYGNPSIRSALDRLKAAMVDKILVIPLYPQYASSSTGSTIEETLRLLKEWNVIPSLDIISSFHAHPAFIEAWTETAKKYFSGSETYDHFLFSFHGIPERQLQKASDHYCAGSCRSGNCCDEQTDNNRYCYRASCFHTARLIAANLHIPGSKYTVCFQSRLGRTEWIKPYTDAMVREKASAGVRRMLVFAPSFVADCLETLHEIREEYARLFREHGGGELHLAESLNAHPAWIKALAAIVREHTR